MGLYHITAYWRPHLGQVNGQLGEGMHLSKQQDLAQPFGGPSFPAAYCSVPGDTSESNILMKLQWYLPLPDDIISLCCPPFVAMEMAVSQTGCNQQDVLLPEANASLAEAAFHRKSQARHQFLLAIWSG